MFLSYKADILLLSHRGWKAELT